MLLLNRRPVRNLCRSSESFGSVWTATGTPTRTPAAHTASGVSLDLIGDDDGAAVERYEQPITLTGSAVKAASFFVKEGTSVSMAFQLIDTTASANRLKGVVAWSGGLPVVTMDTGTFDGDAARGDGVFRLGLITTFAIDANSHILRVFPATDVTLAQTAATGTIYMGGVQIENRHKPSRTYRRTF